MKFKNILVIRPGMSFLPDWIVHKSIILLSIIGNCRTLISLKLNYQILR